MKLRSFFAAATLLAVTSIALLAFSFDKQISSAQPALTEGWFVYNGGSPNSPGSYSPSGGAPNCPGAVTLCAIYAQINPSTGQPTQASIDELRDISSNFTEEVEGLIDLKQ